MALVHISALGSWAQWGICFQAAAQSKALQAHTTNLCWKPQCSTGLRAQEGRGAGACGSEEPLAQSDLYLFDVRKIYIVCRLETINMTIRREEWILCVGGFHQLWPLIWPRDWCLWKIKLKRPHINSLGNSLAFHLNLFLILFKCWLGIDFTALFLCDKVFPHFSGRSLIYKQIIVNIISEVWWCKVVILSNYIKDYIIIVIVCIFRIHSVELTMELT